MAKISSFSWFLNIVQENLHYLGNYYSYSESENGIRRRITFPIAVASIVIRFELRSTVYPPEVTKVQKAVFEINLSLQITFHFNIQQ